jgi:3-oxoacid CoA-transferase A subunit
MVTTYCRAAGEGGTGAEVTLVSNIDVLQAHVLKKTWQAPRNSDAWPGEIELELVPQGNLAERIRAVGAGIGGFFTPTGYGTTLAEGKETRFLDGKWQVFETPIHADVVLIEALTADGRDNLVYRKTERNFGRRGETHHRPGVRDRPHGRPGPRKTS